jgi:AcrR family transcriptional regulator
MPKPPNPEIKHRIDELVLRQINTEGVDSLSMRNLANELSITPTTLYYYYESKEALVRLARDKAIEYMFDFVMNEVNKKNKPHRKLEKYISSYIEWGVSNPYLFDIIFKQKKYESDNGDLDNNKITILAYDLLLDLIADNSIHSINHQTVLALLNSSLFGIVYTEILNGNDNSDIQSIANEFADLFINGFIKKKKK